MNGLLTQIQADIDAAFPLIRPDLDSNPDGGKEKHWDHHQILMGSERLLGGPIYPRERMRGAARGRICFNNVAMNN